MTKLDTALTRQLLDKQIESYKIAEAVKADFNKAYYKQCEVCGCSMLAIEMESVTVDDEETQALICPLCFNHVEDNRYLPPYEADPKEEAMNEVTRENCRGLSELIF